MGSRLTWGAVVPHGGSGEYAGLTGAHAWERLATTACEFENLGFDHLWLSDHLMASGGDRSGIHFEAYTTLAALAGLTTKIRLGVLVTCAQYRSVAVLAKQAANVDVFSGGRFIFGLGGGWDADEFRAYGLPFPSPGDRVGRFAETLEAVLKLWTDPVVDFAGEYIRLDGAACNPRPQDRPPVWTGAHGPRALRATARFADVANWNVDLPEFIRLRGVLDEACAAVGRDRTEVETSVFRLADLTDDQSALSRLMEAENIPSEFADQIATEHLIGPPDKVLKQVQAFVDAGAHHLVVMFVDAAESLESAKRFTHEVIPRVRYPRQ